MMNEEFVCKDTNNFPYWLAPASQVFYVCIFYLFDSCFVRVYNGSEDTNMVRL